MGDFSGNYVGEVNPKVMTVEGPFGAGKTTFAIETLFVWLEAGIAPEKILVIVPQRTLAQRYLLALRDTSRGTSDMVDVRTLGGLAKDISSIYWPLIAREMGFADLAQNPRFLTIETSQYIMASFVEAAFQKGKFEAVSVSPHQIARQVLDNLGKAALMGIDYRKVPDLLAQAWGAGRPRRRILAYQAAGEVAHAFRQYCLEYRLLDYSLQVELFHRLLEKSAFREQYFSNRTHLIVEHLEEEAAFTHNLLRQWIPYLEGVLLVYEWWAGYRVFLGADPEGGFQLSREADGILTLDRSYITSSSVDALLLEVAKSMDRTEEKQPAPGQEPAFSYQTVSFFPEMLDWAAAEIAHLIRERETSPGKIAVLVPYLSDALRFSLGQKLDRYGIPHVSHRPSRALRDEPAARCTLTLAALAHPQWDFRPHVEDVALALQMAIDGLDPVRAQLLAKVIYHPSGDFWLTPFTQIKPTMQARVTYLAGQRYEQLLDWLKAYHQQAPVPPDHFFSRLFGEILSQLGFGFHNLPDAGRIVSELVESARKFRLSLFSDESLGIDEVGRRYFNIVNQGLLSALYVDSWRDELAEAVFIAPAYTFLMRNRAVDVQFWLDVGSTGWWERLDQPLTHPYVLSPGWKPGDLWTDADEIDKQKDMLFRLMTGLIRRTRNHIYLGISDLGEQGYEQRGPMLQIFQ
nr:hypothetical protein [Anaerolineae bacterium]